MTENPILPYVEETHDQYTVQAAEKFTGIRDDEDVVLSGPCPRCADPVTAVFTKEVVRRPAADQPYVVVVCNCSAPHPRRPHLRTGCGAYWTLVISGAST
uniref:Transferase n=1 Tax=uncultured soil bacterium TaxID=164851 RepID=E2D2M3_9BACT|nr:transferase [uncultured soil bacterium]